MVLSWHMPSALATDLYQVTMMAGYHASGQDQPRTFELFVRGLPDHRQYLVAAGLEQALEYLTTLHFTADEIAWLRTLGALADVPSSFFEQLPAGVPLHRRRVGRRGRRGRLQPRADRPR